MKLSMASKIVHIDFYHFFTYLFLDLRNILQFSHSITDFAFRRILGTFLLTSCTFFYHLSPFLDSAGYYALFCIYYRFFFDATGYLEVLCLLHVFWVSLEILHFFAHKSCFFLRTNQKHCDDS